MILRTNQKVITPIGAGIVQGGFAIQDSQAQPVVNGVLVRLPVDDVTRSQLNKSNCLTPHAKQSGVWVFSENQLSL